jgi:hypothetical protein
MRFQRDSGSLPDFRDAGLSRAESGQDVPRWLVMLGAVAGCTLFVALVRYAIDLLGVVFVIILVGFAIRALSDWLTEGESVSGWAMSALSLGLTGTVLVGMWLASSSDLSGSNLERRLPGPIQSSVTWLEERGWGQRVLLPGRPGAAVGPSGSVGGGTSPGPIASEPPPGSPASLPALRPIPGAAPSSARSRTQPRRSSPGEAAAAARSGEPSAPTAPPPAATSPVPVATQLRLVAPVSSVVGRSVRLAVQVQAPESSRSPGGHVVFYAGGREIGRAAVRGGTAVLSTLSLELGPHQLSASYEGDEWHLASTSASVGHTVQRQ